MHIENYVDSTLLRLMYLSWLAKCLDQHRYTIGKPLLKTGGSSLGRHNWISVWTTEALHVILASVGPMQILQAQHWLNVGLRYLGQNNIKVLLAFQSQSIVGPTVGDYVGLISKMTLISTKSTTTTKTTLTLHRYVNLARICFFNQ